ncbi:MAG: hypothetical protein EOO77_37570, partial [Oxalobacteraceae bacterium]
MSSLLARIYAWLGIRSHEERVLRLSHQPNAQAAEPAKAFTNGNPAPNMPSAASNLDDKRKSLHAAFNSSRPVDAPAELAGREQEIATLITTVFDEDAHALIHGARGSGKTSLARVFGAQADQRGIVTIYLACDAIDSFSELFIPY